MKQREYIIGVLVITFTYLILGGTITYYAMQGIRRFLFLGL